MHVFFLFFFLPHLLYLLIDLSAVSVKKMHKNELRPEFSLSGRAFAFQALSYSTVQITPPRISANPEMLKAKIPISTYTNS